MEQPVLIVSNPPQHQPDFQAAAPVFFLSVTELHMKSNYNVPEIWFADSDEDAISATVAYLREAGFRISVLPGQDIASVPSQQSVCSFSFTDSSVVFNLSESELVLAYDSPCVAVLCQPRPRRPGETTDQNSGHSDDDPFLDIITSQGGQISRVSVFQSLADFSGLATAPVNAADSLATLAAEIKSHFAQAHVDKRLVGMRLRDKPTVSATHGHEPDRRRKRYSYATTELSTLLASISENLKDISQPDLSSRLIYLTSR